MNPKRKTDRRVIAYQIAAFARDYGADGTVTEEWPAPGCREAMVEIRLGDARVGITISPRQATEGYCVPWNIASGSDARFSPAFGVAAAAPVNPFHRRKCMAFYDTLPDTLMFLERALRCINDGSAFV